jgi:sulfate transport system permease protein
VVQLAVSAAPAARLRHTTSERAATALSLGFTTSYLTLIVVLPIAALLWTSRSDGVHGFWDVVTGDQALAALKLSFGLAVVVTLINAVLGTITAWVLVRDEFRGKALVNAVIDLPFALPTIVAGLTLLALYGPSSPVGIDIAFTRTAIALSLLFVTLPFVVRTVQPVLHELDRDAEEAARSLGASEARVFRTIVLPTLLPGILSGVALAFARAMGEIGAVVLVSGNLPFKTEVASVFIFNRVQSGDPAGAAAVATVLLVLSFAILLAIGGLRRLATRHERA